MNESADLVVIGGGVIGLSAALFAARAGAGRVHLIERATVCSGTTGQSGALIRQHYSNDFTSALARDSLRVFQNWSETIGGSCGFTSTGALVLAGSITEPEVARNVAMHRSLGIDVVRLDPGAIAQLEPRLNLDGVTSGCWEPTAGTADPVAAVLSLAHAARAAGARIEEHRRATALSTHAGWIAGVETSSGGIAVDRVLVAANIWGPALLSPLGLDLPLTASRHPMALLRRTGDAAPIHPAVLDVERQAYLIPRGSHTLSGSLGTHPSDLVVDPASYSRGVTAEEIDRFVASAGQRMPAMASAVVHGGWAGIYDESPDAHPVLGPAPGVEGLHVALGFSGHGFKLAPEFGRLLARAMVEGADAAPELLPFRWQRFAEGRPIGSAFSASVLA